MEISTDKNSPSNKFKELCIHEHFELQAEKSPNAIALAFEDAELTYSELNQKSNQLARFLVSNGITPDTLVGIHMERGLGIVIATLAVLKSGGAYLPLDPSYPEQGLKHMLNDSGVELLLTQKNLQDTFPTANQHRIYLDFEKTGEWLDPNLSNQEKINIPISQLGLTNNNIAYAIYTSGSTGAPKGVMIEHKAAMNFLDASFQRLSTKGHTPTSHWLLATGLSFDIAALELFSPLCNGGKAVLLRGGWTDELHRLPSIIERHNVSVIQTTPTQWQMILNAGFKANPHMNLLIGGERVTHSIASDLVETGANVWNCYGPTEATIWSHMRLLYKDNRDFSDIGNCLNNYQEYVVTDKNELAKTGEMGELYLGGNSIARGYINRPNLDIERFIANPFSNTSSASNDRLYKTGDLVSVLSTGDLEYIGRADDQIKINGIRIEPGEIETQLNQHELVNSSVLSLYETGETEKSLVVSVIINDDYIKVTNHQDITLALQQHLAKNLPEYLIPEHFILMSTFPLKENGKIDRHAIRDKVEQQIA